MIYTLIFVITQYQRTATAAAVEFNSLQACQAAAVEVRKQTVSNNEGNTLVLFCAAKGEKK